MMTSAKVLEVEVVISFYIDFESSIEIISDHLDVHYETKESKVIPWCGIYLFNPHSLGINE